MTEDIYIDLSYRDGTEPEATWFESVVRDVLRAEKVQPAYEVSLMLADEKTVHDMNRHYRNVDAPTDVISFYTETPSDGTESFVLPDDGVRRLGDVVISYPQAIEQAREAGHSPRRELTLLVIHGVLHLLGYDHEIPDDAARMRGREAALLEEFGGRHYA